MTATLPIVEGGEVPIPLETPKRRKTTPRKRKAAAPVITIEVEPPASPDDTILDRPARAVFAGVPVEVTAIGEKRVRVRHDEPLASEGDLILRIPGLFAELSRLGGRVTSTNGSETSIEITRNAIALAFALDAVLHPVEDSRPRLSTESPTAAGGCPPLEKAKLLAPTRALPATFGDIRLALLEVHGTRLRVAHSRALPVEGEHPFAIKTDIGDFSGSDARVVSSEWLQEGRDVYVTTIEITGNAVSFTCAIDELVRAQLLQEKSIAPAAEIPVIEADPEPLPHPRDRRPPLVPIARTYPAPRRERRWQPLAIVVGIILLAAAVIVGYVKRPDDHLDRAQKMIEAYEDGLMPSERDYTLPVYTNALKELAEVRPESISEHDAQKLAEHIRHLIARKRAQR
jgi:hypothetical protein